MFLFQVTGLFLFDKRLGAISAELDPHGDPRRLMDAALDTNENILERGFHIYNEIKFLKNNMYVINSCEHSSKN